MWRGMTAVTTLRDDLTFILSASIRKYDIFSCTHTSPILFQPFFPSVNLESAWLVGFSGKSLLVLAA